jgi:transketolase
MEGTHNVHGAALGDKEIAAVRAHIGWEYAPFEIPADVYAAWDAKADGAKAEADWNAQFTAYTAKFPQKAAELTRRMKGDLPANFDEVVANAIAACVEKKKTSRPVKRVRMRFRHLHHRCQNSSAVLPI